MAEGIRLNKALADAGVCSRRRADELVFAGRVRVNGTVADSPGVRVAPGDRVELDGRPVLLKAAEEKACWLMLNKPVRIVSTASDPEGRETVLDLVPDPWRHKRLFPVGRLDYFSEGSLLLTNDGQCANRLMHPRHHVPKEYEVIVRGQVTASFLEQVRRGMRLSDGTPLLPAEIEARPLREGDRSLLRIVLHQGINRQIRRMCADGGLTILRLRRVRIGHLALGTLPSGKLRPLTEQEIARFA